MDENARVTYEFAGVTGKMVYGADNGPPYIKTITLKPTIIFCCSVKHIFVELYLLKEL